MDWFLWFLAGIPLGAIWGLYLHRHADYESTATGYVLLDKLLSPYFRWRSRRESRRFIREAIKRGDPLPKRFERND